MLYQEELAVMGVKNVCIVYVWQALLAVLKDCEPVLQERPKANDRQKRSEELAEEKRCNLSLLGERSGFPMA